MPFDEFRRREFVTLVGGAAAWLRRRGDRMKGMEVIE